MARSYHGSILKIDMNCQITFFQWTQLKHAIPSRWKKLIFDYSGINENDLYQNHHVIERAGILPLDKLSSTEIYSILTSNVADKPTPNCLKIQLSIRVKFTCHHV